VSNDLNRQAMQRMANERNRQAMARNREALAASSRRIAKTNQDALAQSRMRQQKKNEQLAQALQVSSYTCRKCGASRRPGASYCHSCGAPLGPPPNSYKPGRRWRIW